MIIQTKSGDFCATARFSCLPIRIVYPRNSSHVLPHQRNQAMVSAWDFIQQDECLIARAEITDSSKSLCYRMIFKVGLHSKSRKHSLFTHFPKDRNCEACEPKLRRLLAEYALVKQYLEPSKSSGHRIPCWDFLKRKCTNSSCNYWHPPVLLNYKSETGYANGKKFRFRHVEIDCQPTRKSKKSGCKGSVALLK